MHLVGGEVACIGNIDRAKDIKSSTSVSKVESADSSVILNSMSFHFAHNADSRPFGNYGVLLQQE